MSNLDDENYGYRTAGHVAPGRTAPIQDEQNFSTLKEVRELFEGAVEGLKKDFNAFDLTEGELSIKEQIAVKQGIEAVLSPLLQQVNSAISGVKEKQREIK